MKPISIINKLNESDSMEKSVKSKLRELFGNISVEPEYKGYRIGDSGLCFEDIVFNEDGEEAEGFSFYVDPASHYVIPSVQGGNLEIQAPDYIRDSSGESYGDLLSFPGAIDWDKVKSVYDELSTKIKTINPEERDEKGYAKIVEAEEEVINDPKAKGQEKTDAHNDIKDNNKRINELESKDKLTEDTGNGNYKYIDSSEMGDCVYNSLSNTDVIEILDELKRYFDESVVSIEEVNKNSNHDTGMGSDDINACKIGSKNIQEIIDALNKAWE